jgi:hypothetical protein
MSRVECPHESDVLTAVYTRRWPDRADSALKAHVETCQTCADLATVSFAFEEECDGTRGRVAVPDAGLVWWRSHLRSRQDAARAAVRPITVAQAVALAATVGVLGAVFGATTTWFQQGLRTIAGLFRSTTPWTLPVLSESLAATIAGQWILVSGAMLALLVTPIAVYFAVKDD